MSEFLIRNPQGFPLGYTPIIDLSDELDDAGTSFGILKLSKGEQRILAAEVESAYLLLDGKCEFRTEQKSYMAERYSLFDEDPLALHFSALTHVEIRAITDCELSVSQVKNNNSFETLFFDKKNMLESEQRGKGLLDDTACRIVRTIFDKRNRPESNMVLGEVITLPGRWSSYPPHHHAQPEIYHYRFTEKQGYGHAECGDHVFKVTQYDTYKILDENDHAQTAAPGYGMYYIWVIRHLDNHPYHLPIFTEAHQWTKTEEANKRVWRMKA